MRNREIEKDEINKITARCPIRERAFFTIMRQSGLAPHAIKRLKIKNVEEILQPNTPRPSKIIIPQEKSPAFMGNEAVNYLKQYLATRTNLTPNSLLFTLHSNPNKEINTKDVSRTFRRAAQKLEKERKITYEVRKGKPSELRLYSLINFYRKNAENYLTELDNIDTQMDDELYRKLYEEKAMPFLEIEPPSPIDIHQLKKENKELKERLTIIEESMMPVTRLYHELLGTIPERILSELRPDIPVKNEEDREQRIQGALHKLVESIRKEEKQQKPTVTPVFEELTKMTEEDKEFEKTLKKKGLNQNQNP